jgi:glyoxylase-like metal-dependent hydrolase (beta-lactamase superfamily II)
MNSKPFHFQVGNFACTVFLDGMVPYPPAMFFTNLRKEEYDPLLRQRGQGSEEIETPYTCLFINTGRERVLVDTGAGNFSPTAGNLLPQLRAEGIEPGEIDAVVLSHGHPDHIGGNLNQDGKPTFPNARYVLFKEEWDFWMSNPSLGELPVDARFKEAMLASAQKNLPPIQGQLDLLQQETEIHRGVSAIAAFGHTPGHMALEISSAGQQLIFVADAIIDPIDIEYPQARAVIDHQPEKMVSTRVRLLRKAAEGKALLLASHFPFPGLGHVVPIGAGWQWQPIPAARKFSVGRSG